MHYKPKRLLITGGAGFIGSHFIRYYLAQHPDIDTLINLDSLTYAANLETLSYLQSDSRYQFLKGNICDRALIDKLLQTHQIDTIVHFAAESHVDRSIAQATPFIESNIIGTFTLLEAARHYWLDTLAWQNTQCRFHHISTDEVYGSLNATDPAFTETTRYQPRSPYSASKASSDHLVQAYYHTYGLPITMSHCSNNYGPDQHAEKFIPTVMRACLKAEAIPLYGDGKNIRDWLYVIDHCEAIDCILQHGAIGETYHIGGNNERTNLDVAKHICDEFDKHFPEHAPHRRLIEFVTDRLGHDRRYAMDPRKIQETLNWQPRTPFESGMMDTISLYLHHD